jgi:fumarate reductase subunit D
MTAPRARTRVWTLGLAALVLCALTGPVVGLLTPLAHNPAPALTILAAAFAAALVGASVVLAVLLIVAVLRIVRPRLAGHR